MARADGYTGDTRPLDTTGGKIIRGYSGAAVGFYSGVVLGLLTGVSTGAGRGGMIAGGAVGGCAVIYGLHVIGAKIRGDEPRTPGELARDSKERKIGVPSIDRSASTRLSRMSGEEYANYEEGFSDGYLTQAKQAHRYGKAWFLRAGLVGAILGGVAIGTAEWH